MDMIEMVLLGLVVGLALGAVIGALWVRSRPVPTAALEQRAADHALVREGLERLHDQMRDLEHNRVSWQGQFAQQVLDMRHTTDQLRTETRSLDCAAQGAGPRFGQGGTVSGSFGERAVPEVMESEIFATGETACLVPAPTLGVRLPPADPR